MGTKQSTTQSNAYDPSSMSAFQGLQPSVTGGLQNLMGMLSNPTGSPFFQSMFGQGTKNASQLGQTGMQNITNNANAFGGGQNMPGFMQALMGQQARGTSGLQQNAFWNSMGNAQNMGMQGLMGAENYRPLQTGSNQLQQTTGLGTWLPQLIGSLGGAAMGGGLGGLFGGGSGGGGSPFGNGLSGSLGLSGGMPAPQMTMPSSVPFDMNFGLTGQNSPFFG